MARIGGFKSLMALAFCAGLMGCPKDEKPKEPVEVTPTPTRTETPQGSATPTQPMAEFQ